MYHYGRASTMVPSLHHHNQDSSMIRSLFQREGSQAVIHSILHLSNVQTLTGLQRTHPRKWYHEPYFVNNTHISCRHVRARQCTKSRNLFQNSSPLFFREITNFFSTQIKMKTIWSFLNLHPSFSVSINEVHVCVVCVLDKFGNTQAGFTSIASCIIRAFSRRFDAQLCSFDGRAATAAAARTEDGTWFRIWFFPAIMIDIQAQQGVLWRKRHFF